MKHLIPLAGLLAAALTAPAQTLRLGLKAGAAFTQARITDLPTMSSSGSGGSIYLADNSRVEARAQPALLAGLSAETRLRPRWGLGAELLLAYEPLQLRRQQLPPVGSLHFNPDKRRYRYTLLRLALPLYATYQPASAWQLQLGAAPSLLLDRQVRITATEPELQNGQTVTVTSGRKATDHALRPLSWRLLLGVQYALSPATALELRLQPALSNVYRTQDPAALLVPRGIRQHALSLGVRYALGRPAAQ